MYGTWDSSDVSINTGYTFAAQAVMSRAFPDWSNMVVTESVEALSQVVIDVRSVRLAPL